MSASNPHDRPEPTLAPPGAGLPLPELLIARLRFRLVRWRRSREDFCRMFETASARVLELARSVDPEAAARRVLIRRPRGLEDSSRNWSMFMTVDHLRIVNTGVLGIGRALGRGEAGGEAVSTADVKPAPDAGVEVLESFEKSCELLAKTFAKIDDLRTPTRHPHPWFGPIDAAGWHALAGFHTRLHVVQLERILAGL